jgi:hypothetical protein
LSSDSLPCSSCFHKGVLGNITHKNKLSHN